jgi:glyoxylate reductase
MSRAKPLVIVTRRLPETVETRMRELFRRASISTTGHVAGRARGCHAQRGCPCPNVTDHIDEQMLEQAGERLKLIANFGNGVDNIDVDAR